MSAVRVARAATSRDKIIKFAGCYHGHADPFLVQAGSGATTLGVPTSPGVPGGTADTLVARYNDSSRSEDLSEIIRGGSPRCSSNQSPATWGSSHRWRGFCTA